jgi:hypothetical protein
MFKLLKLSTGFGTDKVFVISDHYKTSSTFEVVVEA